MTSKRQLDSDSTNEKEHEEHLYREFLKEKNTLKEKQEDILFGQNLSAPSSEKKRKVSKDDSKCITSSGMPDYHLFKHLVLTRNYISSVLLTPAINVIPGFYVKIPRNNEYILCLVDSLVVGPKYTYEIAMESSSKVVVTNTHLELNHKGHKSIVKIACTSNNLLTFEEYTAFIMGKTAHSEHSTPNTVPLAIKVKLMIDVLKKEEKRKLSPTEEWIHLREVRRLLSKNKFIEYLKGDLVTRADIARKMNDDYILYQMLRYHRELDVSDIPDERLDLIHSLNIEYNIKKLGKRAISEEQRLAIEENKKYIRDMKLIDEELAFIIQHNGKNIIVYYDKEKENLSDFRRKMRLIKKKSSQNSTTG